MQEALIRLSQYWADHGCAVMQPMNTEVGAGTLNPATALRVLGPEPWRVGYVEPSVRPDDSRYGDNPNRLQTHTQYQVILKPEPAKAQELYLGSLQALGIDTAAHDVRFVEDNWASPALGAWGLGWEVWLDGLEITQFTYFQQSGGLTLDPVSVEITYGMERIIMALQGVSHFKDITYTPDFSYGELFGQVEYEMSRYYLDDADIATTRTLFDSYEAEARRLIDARLPVPAHSQVLKCSQAFNVLDARGAIGTTERARAFARMRNLAHEVAKLWVERREENGFPLGVASTQQAEPAQSMDFPEIAGPATLVLEIGVEEMPPSEVERLPEALRQALRERLAQTRLGHGDITAYAAPRRLIARIEQVQPREEDYEHTVRGPRLAAAYDAENNPTKAALGFARGQGVEVSDLEQITVSGGEYVGLVRQVHGRQAAEVLAEVLGEAISGLRGEKNMRWSAPGLSFTRPIRWILALLGEQVVPFSVSTLTSDRTTQLHRFASPSSTTVVDADSLLSTLAGHGIVADATERRERILNAATTLAGEVGGVIDVDGDHGTVGEIVHLVEEPVAIRGSFDESYLKLPADILTTVMRKHQRYLPVRDQQGNLLPTFITIANGACDLDQVRAGNEAVLRARYDDAAFFYHNDLRTPPDQIKHGLEKLTFEQRLGSMADRAQRIAAIATDLTGHLDLTAEEKTTVTRAGALAKFDLASDMVIELSSLAGIMAREYARQAGEDPSVAQALFEMEQPRWATDAYPESLPGAVLALADRLDLLTGLFAIGSGPTGSSDPFGLRRAALGLTGILRTQPRLAPLSVSQLLTVAAAHQPVHGAVEAVPEAEQFITRRFEQYLIDAGHAVDVVRAVLLHADTPARAEQDATDLSQLKSESDFRELAAALQRVQRILPDGQSSTYDPALFTEPAEQALHEALTATAGKLREHTVNLREFTPIARTLIAPINEFFDSVMVMTKDPEVQANRLGLLAQVNACTAPALAWPELVWS
ncbi:glycine--tRNA ligase [Lipingzhangella sp. LS1_29]|uniref:Multifunctional fusion protein n=1 Tax=Lipingzhangella rawalii TaxID=2055835 RepID=A0ABU2H3F5_9ACTN|nr:glycine--tRNA ligase [Lipingzhangella rawalii]MDS1269834.1 glycine--tRNA ligase [Lipingzhangella rawalii]